MDLDDFWEPEVAVVAGVAAAVTAAVASPQVRRVMRQGAVYGLAGMMIVGDRIAAAARGVKNTAQQAAGAIGSTAHQTAGAATEAAAEAAG
jgi:hypothetical protein